MKKKILFTCLFLAGFTNHTNYASTSVDDLQSIGQRLKNIEIELKKTKQEKGVSKIFSFKNFVFVSLIILIIERLYYYLWWAPKQKEEEDKRDK